MALITIKCYININKYIYKKKKTYYHILAAKRSLLAAKVVETLHQYPTVVAAAGHPRVTKSNAAYRPGMVMERVPVAPAL